MFWCGNFKEGDRLEEEAAADVTIFLNYILNLLEERLWTRLNCLELGKNGRLL
jgi:hypothetical protein